MKRQKKKSLRALIVIISKRTFIKRETFNKRRKTHPAETEETAGWVFSVLQKSRSRTTCDLQGLGILPTRRCGKSGKNRIRTLLAEYRNRKRLHCRIEKMDGNALLADLQNP